MSVKQKVQKAISAIIEELGYELVEVVYRKEHDGMALTIFIDNEKGISLNDCELVSRAIDPILDELDPTDNKPYTLNVSSPGVDRPLKTDKDYEKNMGKDIQISLYRALDNKKKFEGKLIDYDETSLTIDNNCKQKFLRKDVAVARPVIKF